LEKIAVIYTLVGSKEEALSLSKELIENHSAACINIFECQSVYEWEGKIQNSPEWALIIKTASEKCQTVRDILIQKHPYQIPAILFNDQISALKPFTDWVGKPSSN
jgi:periplasmic divalent cation tolerance protein